MARVRSEEKTVSDILNLAALGRSILDKAAELGIARSGTRRPATRGVRRGRRAKTARVDNIEQAVVSPKRTRRAVKSSAPKTHKKKKQPVAPINEAP